MTNITEIPHITNIAYITQITCIDSGISPSSFTNVRF